MNQSQIEILIKLRNEADAGLARLSEHIKRTTGEFTGLAGGADRATDALDKRLKPAGVATGVVMGNLAVMAGQKVYQAFTQTIGAANRLDSALIGLSSVAKHMGEDVDGAKRAAISLASDGLMSVSESAAGLKNLLSSGLSLEQAVTLMNRLKESATFNRQAHYELGGAVVATTEGIKNGNSVLADASGVTKNLSVMLKEAGISQDKMAAAQKDGSYQAAIYNGFLKETEGSVGNVNKYLDTAAGKQAQFSAAVLTTQQAIGQKLQPVIGALLDTMMPLVEVIGDNAGALVPLGMAVATVVAPLILMNTVSRLGIGNLSGLTDQASKLWTTFQKVNASSFGGFLPGLRTVGAEAGITTASLGKLGTAAAIAGTAFAGWQIGRAIADLLDLDEKINRVVNNLDLLDPARMKAAQSEAAAMAMLAAAEEKVRVAREKHGASAARTAELELEIIRRDPVILQMKEQISRAIQSGASATISYADAVKYNADVETVRLAAMNRSAAVLDANAARESNAARLSFQYARQTKDTTAARLKDIEVQRGAVDAEERLGRISSQTAAARRLALDEEKKGLTVRQNMVSVGEVTAQMEKRIAAEIAATGRSMASLVTELDTNEAGFRAWAKQVDLSSETVKAIEARLKAKTESTKAATKENNEYRKSIEEVRDSLEQWGLIGMPVVERELKELDAMVNQAKADKIAYASVITSMLIPALEALQQKAQQSGVDASAITRRLEEARGVALMAKLAHTATLPPLPVVTQFNEAYFRSLGLMGQGVDILSDSRREAILSANAMQHFGLTSRTELDAAAKASRAHYEQLLKMGTATPEQLAKAHKQMVEDMNAASGAVPSFWQREVVPGITNAVDQMRQSVATTFAQMIRGVRFFGSENQEQLRETARESEERYRDMLATGTSTSSELFSAWKDMYADMEKANGQFSDGFVAIWESIKSSVLNIFDDIVSAFLDQVLGKIISGMNGKAGTFGQSLFGGSSRALPALLSGGGGVGPQGFAVPNLIGGGGTVGAGGGFLASGAAGVLGGAGAAVGGFMAGRDLTGRYGKTKGAIGGMASGAAMGAMMGSVIPGLGTVVGGVIGGVAGLAGGLFGETKGQKEDKAANREIANIRAELIKTYGSMEKIREMGKLTGVDLAGAFGHVGKRGLEQFLGTIEQFEAANAKIENAASLFSDRWDLMPAHLRIKEITESMTGLQDSHDALVKTGWDHKNALKAQEDGWNELLDKALSSGKEIPEGLRKIGEELLRNGLLTEENKLRMIGYSTETIARLGELQKEYDALKESVEAEAPEEVMGVIEAASRARMAEIEAEKIKLKERDEVIEDGAAGAAAAAKLVSEGWATEMDFARRHVEDFARDARAALEGVWGTLRAMPGGYTGGGVPGRGPSTVDLPGAANGIYASSPTFRVFAEREPELGGPVGFMSKALAGALERVPALSAGGGPVAITITPAPVILDGRTVGRVAFSHGVDEARRLGLTRRRR